MPGMAGMHANLVGPAGDGARLDQRCHITEALHYPEFGQGLLAFRIDLHHALARTKIVLQQGRMHLLQVGRPADRKSTRLNSSHVRISYAVFCLKKKKKKKKRKNTKKKKIRKTTIKNKIASQVRKKKKIKKKDDRI